MTYITYKDNGVAVVAHVASGVTASRAAASMNLTDGSWREITAEEAAALMQPTLEEARAAKLAAIIAGADAVKAALSARFSVLEESTWPEQEAGARQIVNDAAGVKDATARLILLDPESTAAAVDLVTHLAAVDGTALQDFAARILVNADTAYTAGIATLIEQRALEKAVNAATSAEDVAAVAVTYSVAEHLYG
ncbi:MAG: hypothetical protein DELT_01737 [Desulfovibrio sp.]